MIRTKKQHEIRDVSAKLFVEKGYAETSMRDIAANMKVKAASLYAHINSKEQILDWICFDYFNRMETALHDLESKGFPEPEQFREFINVYITTILEDVDKFLIFQKYWKLCDRYYDKFSEGIDELFFKLTILLQRNLKNDAKLNCFVDGSTTMIILDILDSVPKYIHKDCTDISSVVNEIQKRILYGFS